MRRIAGAKVKRIMTGMGISAAALARVLGVSRQTLYNWINGDQASENHATRIDTLMRAHEALLTVDQPQRPLLTQPLRASQNFWQLVQTGEDPEVLARAILASQGRRADQRALMAERLAAKRAKGTVVDGSSDDLT
ncbi:MAG TPA: helix-turn-helix transcriptional regulator [Frateuria sp.]|uniref:helix-turn-helix transcriptional regulator n=1 Tax=Frateuria sp. TaxID=2211372 RepID=UPI002DF713CD|nr:helix-turn-helix transcriptional regulator [Frateuria sp.]